MKTISATLCGTVLASSLLAQQPTTLLGTEQFFVTSKGGLQYRIDVSLPPRYAVATADRYPVLYLLDGNLEFAIAAETQRLVNMEGGPELIIVGIGYQEDDPAVYTEKYSANRRRDYTPTAPAEHPGGGQAQPFLAFLRDELIPTIDRRYRTDPADRGLGGHSLGGLFTTYTLLHESGIFRRYWLGSPSLWWDRQLAFRWLDTAAAPAAGTRVYLSVGELEGDIMVDPMTRMAAALKARFPKLDVVSNVHQGDNHLSVVAGSITRALKVLYRRPTTAISAADERALSGRWTSTGGQSFTIGRKNGQLEVSDTFPGFRASSALRAYTRDELASVQGVPYLVSRDSTGKVTWIIRRLGTPDSLFRKVGGKP
jgi:predicted alpha/beta superfamily hydrolase